MAVKRTSRPSSSAKVRPSITRAAAPRAISSPPQIVALPPCPCANAQVQPQRVSAHHAEYRSQNADPATADHRRQAERAQECGRYCYRRCATLNVYRYALTMIAGEATGEASGRQPGLAMPRAGPCLAGFLAGLLAAFGVRGLFAGDRQQHFLLPGSALAALLRGSGPDYVLLLGLHRDDATASMRLMTLPVGRSCGTSIFSPLAFFSISSLRACS